MSSVFILGRRQTHWSRICSRNLYTASWFSKRSIFGDMTETEWSQTRTMLQLHLLRYQDQKNLNLDLIRDPRDTFFMSCWLFLSSWSEEKKHKDRRRRRKMRKSGRRSGKWQDDGESGGGVGSDSVSLWVWVSLWGVPEQSVYFSLVFICPVG